MPVVLGLLGFVAIIAGLAAASSSSSAQAQAPLPAALPSGSPPLPVSNPELMDPYPESATNTAPSPVSVPSMPAIATQETLASSAIVARENNQPELANEIASRIPNAPTNAAVANAVVEQTPHIRTFEEEMSAQPSETRRHVEDALVDGDVSHLPLLRTLSSAMNATGNPAIAAHIEEHIRDVVALGFAPVAAPVAAPVPNLVPAPTPVNVPTLIESTPTVTPIPPNSSAQTIEAAVNADLAPTPTQPDQNAINRETARNLAPVIVADLIANRRAGHSYSYNRTKVKEFQRLMNLAADGLYGRATEGAMIALGVANVPRHLFG